MGEVIKRQRDGRFIGWYIRYYDGDGRRRIKASKQATHGEARRMLLQIEAQIARGQLGTAEPQTKLTVAELCARFLAAAHPRARCQLGYRRSASSGLNRILPLIGALRLSKLRRREIEQARDKLSLRYKPNTVRSALRPLGAALTSSTIRWAAIFSTRPCGPSPGTAGWSSSALPPARCSRFRPISCW